MIRYKESSFVVYPDGTIKNFKTGNIIKGYITSVGYMHVSVSQRKVKKVKEYYHRIVAWCYVPNPNGYKQVNHKDGNKLNNHPDNLEWCTSQQNVTHAIRSGLMRGISEYEVLLIYGLYKGGLRPSEIGFIMGPTGSSIIDIIKGDVYKEIWARSFNHGSNTELDKLANDAVSLFLDNWEVLKVEFRKRKVPTQLSINL